MSANLRPELRRVGVAILEHGGQTGAADLLGVLRRYGVKKVAAIPENCLFDCLNDFYEIAARHKVNVAEEA